jgi:hypothetical protein
MSTRRATRRRSLVVLAIAMVVGFALVTSGSSSLAQQGTTSGLADGGVLSLHLGSSGTSPQDYLGFRAPDGSGGYAAISKKQSITNGQGCKIALGAVAGAADQLISFTPAGGSNPNTGFVSDAIGVVSSGEGNGQPCGRIDKPPGQTLAMDLGSALGGKVIDYAEIDVELKFGATLGVTGFLNGTQVGSTQTYSSTGSDSGPDSADADNYRIRFPKLLPACGACTTTVNRLVFSIQSQSGGASLEGGADGTQPCDVHDPGECGGATDPDHPEWNFSLGQSLTTNDSLFHLLEADGALDCPSGTGTSEASEQNPGVGESTLFRQENVGGAPCTPIPFNLESGVDATPGCTPGSAQCILLQKDLLNQNTQFIWKVTWNPETTDYPETATEFDFDFDGNFQPLQPCLADSDGDGLPQLPPTLDTEDPETAVDPWCITDTFVDFNETTGENTVTEWYFGQGDPGGKR